MGLIIPLFPLTLPCFFGSAFNVFLVRQFYSGIPKEYDEAALVDGANYFVIYLRIIGSYGKAGIMYGGGIHLYEYLE